MRGSTFTLRPLGFNRRNTKKIPIFPFSLIFLSLSLSNSSSLPFLVCYPLSYLFFFPFSFLLFFPFLIHRIPLSLFVPISFFFFFLFLHFLFWITITHMVHKWETSSPLPPLPLVILTFFLQFLDFSFLALSYT